MHPVAVCFIANFFKTEVFRQVAKCLLGQGYRVFWIATKKKQFRQLATEFGEGQVLYINRSFISRQADPVGDFRINELIYGDRVWKYEPDNGHRFLTNIQKPIFDFIQKNAIRLVFGEITWAHELLINRMVIANPGLRCGYYDCALVRIPNRRIAFFAGEDHGKMVEFDHGETVTDIIGIERPAYLALNDRIVRKSATLSGRLNRLKRFVSGENIEKDDPNVIVNKLTRIKVKGGEELNRLTYARIETVGFDAVRGSKFVFFGFHKQPEASIDVLGRYYEDQAMNILNLWRILPLGWKIVVKEHTNAIGDRSLRFYRNLLEYPGILLIDENTDSRALIEESSLVVTVSGTIAYEAALLRKPAVTLAPVFFNRINYCRYMSFDELRKAGSLEQLAADIASQRDNRLEFSRYLMRNTFNAYMSDVRTDPDVVNEENVARLVGAYTSLIEKHCSGT